MHVHDPVPEDHRKSAQSSSQRGKIFSDMSLAPFTDEQSAEAKPRQQNSPPPPIPIQTGSKGPRPSRGDWEDQRRLGGKSWCTLRALCGGWSPKIRCCLGAKGPNVRGIYFDPKTSHLVHSISCRDGGGKRRIAPVHKASAGLCLHSFVAPFAL